MHGCAMQAMIQFAPGLALQVLEVLKQLPDLRCLYLKGNPLVTAIRHYRKVVISSIPTLTYLDDRPIFDNERRCAEAWYACRRCICLPVLSCCRRCMIAQDSACGQINETLEQ